MDNNQIDQKKSEKIGKDQIVDTSENKPSDALAPSDAPLSDLSDTPSSDSADTPTSSDLSENASGASRPSEPAISADEPVSADEPADEGDPSPAEPDQDDKNESRNDKKQNPNAKWYVVHTYSGHENKVSHTLKQRIESEHLGDKILDVLVPTQDKIEIKGGKKVNVKEKIFPGYILVKMVLDDISWLAVRTTQGVTSFVGMGNKPTPISEAEVATIVKFTQTEAPMYKQAFMANDTVKIVDGPFADFIGKIDSVDQERGKVKVLVSIFGRETPVELDFLQVQKL